MNIGSLYRVKKYFWLLFPTKEIATAAAAATTTAVATAWAAAYWSGQLNCEVTYFSQEMLIVFLQENGIYKKVLTSDGKIGWTGFDESYNECFEEVNP